MASTETDPSAGAWSRATGELARDLRTDIERGLTAETARRRLRDHGPNELATTAERSPARLLLHQFANTMIAILGVAAVVTYVVGDRIDTIVIAVIVVLDAIVGFVQESRAERAMDELGRLTAPTALAVRDGVAIEVAATDLVPGDLVRLAAGDVVPADLRLVRTAGLQVAEAALTGESLPLLKETDPLPAETGPIGDRRNMAYRGTAVTDGRGDGLVIATGMATELGRIATLLSEDREDTPLQRRLAALGRQLAALAGALCVVVFAAGMARGEDLEEMLVAAISLAVAAIPEGLPAVVTVALALGARRMARHRALVRRLPAVETLGTVSVICSDKTGTLTQNRMTVERVWTPTAQYTVDGRGEDPIATIDRTPGHDAGDGDGLDRLATVALACNDAEVREATDARGWIVTGDPTEGALLVLARRVHVAAPGPRVAEVPFDAGRRRMTTVHRVDDRYLVAVKGALDALLPLLRDGEPVTEAVAAADRLATEGYRVLALAERWLDAEPPSGDGATSELQLLGLVGIADPPRPEAEASIEACRRAGITTVMITGDHPRTARAVAHRLGIVAAGDDGVLTGAEIEGLDDEQLGEVIEGVRVFARTAPAQKLRIVDAWRRRGAIVAMTGDGVNDAPALQRADIGVAMGLNGTDVSREAADMVLADDDFATIVEAVGEGRRIYDNLRRFVLYLLTTNSAEVLVVLLGPFLGLPLPLTATQILFVNLVTDGLPAVALGMEPAEPDVMARRPRPRTESILGRGLWRRSLTIGALMAGAVLSLQVLAERSGLPWQTMGFVTIAALQLMHALTARSGTHRLRGTLGTNPLLGAAVLGSLVLQLAVVYAPGLQDAFGTEALGPAELGIVGAICGAAFVAGELDRRRRGRTNGA